MNLFRAAALSALVLLLSGCPPVETSTDAGASVETKTCTWTTAFSGRFYIDPPSVWLDAGVTPLNHQQAHWWVEVEIKDDQSDTEAVCALRPANREDGAGTCTEDPVGAVSVLESTRTLVLGKLVSLGLLPENGQGYSVMPNELYSENEFRRMVEQNLEQKFGKEVQFCRVRLVVSMLKKQTSDGVWWQKQTMYFPEDSEKCCK